MATILTAVGYMWGPVGVEPEIALINRILGVITAWVVAAIGYLFIRTRVSIRRHEWLQAGQVGQVEVDMVLVLADAAAFADFDGHRARDHVARGQVLGVGRIALHEALAAAVAQDAAFAAHALGDQATGAVDARGGELHEPHVLQAPARKGAREGKRGAV